jgi:hypothetical protein
VDLAGERRKPGMTGFIQKPYRWHTLVEELEKLEET